VGWTPGASVGLSSTTGIFGCGDGHYLWVTGLTSFPSQVGHFERYEPSTDTWTDITRWGTTWRRDCAVAYHGGNVYLISGTEGSDGSGSGSSTAVVRVYDTIGDSWSTVTSIPTAVYQAQAGVVGDFIYVYGGYGSLAMQVYDIIGDSWSSGASLPFTDLNVPNQAVVVGDLIHIIGGADYGGTYDLRNHVTYDTVGDTYDTGFADMPSSLGGGGWGPDGSGAFLNSATGAIWLVVGFADNGGSTDATVVWTPDTWVDGPAAQFSLGTVRIAAAVDGGGILVAVTASTTDLLYQASFGYWDG